MASPVTSYNTLVTAVQELAEDVGTELTSYMPVAIDNAEQRLTKELDIMGLTYTSNPIPLTMGSYLISKPTNHKLTYFVKTVNFSAVQNVLVHRQDDYLTEYWPDLTVTGTPKYYTDVDELTFKIIPPANGSYSVVVKGVKRPDPLSASNQTNMFTRQASDALLFATMIEVSLWQRNDTAYAKYVELYTTARDALNNEGRRQRRDSGEAPRNPDSPANTLGGDN